VFLLLVIISIRRLVCLISFLFRSCFCLRLMMLFWLWMLICDCWGSLLRFVLFCSRCMMSSVLLVGFLLVLN